MQMREKMCWASSVFAILFLFLIISPALAAPRQSKSLIVPAANETVCGAINADTNWTADNVYIVSCDVTVESGSVLTIEPGTVVKFQFDDSLTINGKLVAQGSLAAPVYFTSFRDDTIGGDTNGDGNATVPAVENWGRIQFAEESDDSSIIEHAVIRYSGNDGYSTDDFGAIQLMKASPTLRNITFSNNFLNGIEIGESTWETDTWDNVGIPYVIRRDLTIPVSNTLSIAPGIVVKFDFDDSLFVAGKLHSLGTSNAPISFTSYRDDTIGGDTNGDGDATAPAVENWGRIQFTEESDDSSIIEHAVIRYSGNDGYSNDDYGAIRLMKASPTLRNITFSNNFLNGIEIGESTWETDTWDNVGIPYVIRRDLTIPVSNTLSIAPGIVVKFDFDDSLFVAGKLQSLGKSDAPVHFTSARDDSLLGDTNNNGASSGAAEDWGRIQFAEESDDSSIIEHAVIRYSGNDGYSNDDYGAIRLMKASPTLRNITFANNFINGIEIGESTWETDTWDNVGIPYVINRDLTIPASNTLSIAPGIVVKFDFDDSLFVAGKLESLGTNDAPVHFTSYRDDSLLGDTNNNGASSGAVEDWGRIQFAEESDDSSIIEHAVIRYSGNDGYSNDDYAAIRLINASPTLRDITFTDNYLNGVEIPSASWQSDTWDNTEIVYYVRGTITIPAGETLTIASGQQVVYFYDMHVAAGGEVKMQPGAIIKLSFDDSIIVSGKLVAQGTAVNPVYITSYLDDTIGGDTNRDGDATTPAVENWGRIQFAEESDDSSIIEHAVIRYSGNDGYSNDDYAAIRLINASPILKDITFTDNYLNGVEIPSASWQSDTWDNTEIVYYVRGTITIPAGETLTIASGQQVVYFYDMYIAVDGEVKMQPGAIIKLSFDNSIIVSGKLVVGGTAVNPIYITSYRDDTIGGDTNGDGNATVPAIENWGRIQFTEESDDSSIIEHAVIRYSGNDGYSFNDYAAIQLLATSIYIANVEFQQNYRGVEIIGGGQPVIINSSFTDFSDRAIFNDTPAIPVDARLNWWGDPTGPNHPTLNPGGKGSLVSDGVLFDPWLTASPVGGSRTIEPLALNELKEGEINSLNWLDYEIDIPAGSSVLFQVNPQGNEHQLWLYERAASLPNLASYDGKSTDLTVRNTYDLILSPSQDATYYFSIFNRSLLQPTTDVIVQARIVEQYLSDIAPKTAGNKGETRLSLTGIGFATEGMRVELRQPGTATIIAQEVAHLSSKALAAQFDFIDKPVGLYDIWLFWPNGDSEMISDAFEVTEGVGPILEASLDVRDVYRPNRSYTGWIEYTNVGDADLPIPLFTISTNNPALLKGECDDGWSQNSVQLLGINPDTSFGELPPGGTHRVPFVFESDSLTLDFQLSSIIGSDQAINWGAYKDVMKPNGMPAATWNTLWPDLINRLGSTWSSYLHVLQENARRLQNRGVSGSCVKDLIALEIEQVQGEPVAAVVGQLLDAETFTPITEVDVIAASQDGSILRSEITAVETGQFVIDALADGTYDIYVSGYEIEPAQQFVINDQKDETNVIILATPIRETVIDPVLFFDNPQAIDVAGTPHMVFAVNDQFYHSQYETGQWGNAVKIEGAVGQDPQLRYSETLIDGTQPGMILFWISGDGNDAEIMYSVARNQAGLWVWSDVVSYAAADVASDNPSVTIDDNGVPIVVWQKVDRSNPEDDTDLYYDDNPISSNELLWDDIANNYCARSRGYTIRWDGVGCWNTCCSYARRAGLCFRSLR